MVERFPSSAIEVELGGDYLPWGTVKVRAVVAPACGYEGGHGDIAVLVLARKLVGLGMMRARLADPPTLGETIDPVGFGRCPLSNDGIHRIRREGGPDPEDRRRGGLCGGVDLPWRLGRARLAVGPPVKSWGSFRQA